MKKEIDRIQIKLIHIAKSKLKLTDEDYRTLMMERYPACFGSCKDLSYNEASDLIEYLKKMGFKIVTKKYQHKASGPNIIHLVSPQQLAKIEHLKNDIKWHVHDGFNRWLVKYLKKDHISTAREANSVIEALKGMKARQQSAAEDSTQSLRRDGAMHGGRWQW